MTLFQCPKGVTVTDLDCTEVTYGSMLSCTGTISRSTTFTSLEISVSCNIKMSRINEQSLMARALLSKLHGLEDD